MGSIYKITNTVNGKAYIGQTIHDAVKGRINDHLNRTANGSRLVKRAIEKYGKEAFTYEILHDGIIPEFLDTLEIEAIAKFNTIAPRGYNLERGGNNGKMLSSETRRKISEAHKGKTLSAETRRKISEAHKGKTLSAETRRKISEARKGENHPMFGKPPTKGFSGKRHTPETRRKISEATTGEKNHRYGKLAPNRGKQRSAETRRKISRSNKGKRHTPETCRKISEAHKGKTLTPEHLQKHSESKKGKRHTLETRRKISEAQIGEKNHQYGKPLSAETRRKISQAQETPERIAARKLFFSLPPDMTLTEKRKHLRQRFPEKHVNTVRKWCQKFDSET